MGFDRHRVDKLLTGFHRWHANREFEGAGIGSAAIQQIIDATMGGPGLAQLSTKPRLAISNPLVIEAVIKIHHNRTGIAP